MMTNEPPTAEAVALAQQLYESMDSIASCPGWDQTGDVTRSVWIERAQALLEDFG